MQKKRTIAFNIFLKERNCLVREQTPDLMVGLRLGLQPMANQKLGPRVLVSKLFRPCRKFDLRR